MSDKSSSGTHSKFVSESLCCCEYQNMHGERSHVLMSCCDCEALDESCDKLLKCESVPDSTIDRLINTVSDRCRLPSCLGTGAIQIRPDVALPIILVPLCLCIATLHPVITVLVFLFMPAFIVCFHALWRRSTHTHQTQFFYSWGVTSVISSWLVFQGFVVIFREILLWEMLTVFTCMMIMFYFLHRTKENPDQLRVHVKPRPSHKRTPSNIPPDSSLYDQMNVEIEMSPQPGGNIPATAASPSHGASGGAVKWVDARSNVAKLDLPARAGYCKICESYIAVRDHHCIWINSCVGATNHRYFLMAMIMFVLTGAYAAHLTFTTICTPRMYLDWFLLPNDCRWLYVDFLTAICFVTAVYGVIATSLMSIGLFFQFILISQNLTSHELAQARRSGQAWCGLFVPSNPYNQGFLGTGRSSGS